MLTQHSSLVSLKFSLFMLALRSRIARSVWRMTPKSEEETKEAEKQIEAKETENKVSNDQWRGVADSIRTPIPATINGSKQLPKEVAISCSGCGFLGTYHFGVMICFQRSAQVGF